MPGINKAKTGWTCCVVRGKYPRALKKDAKNLVKGHASDQSLEKVTISAPSRAESAMSRLADRCFLTKTTRGWIGLPSKPESR